MNKKLRARLSTATWMMGFGLLGLALVFPVTARSSMAIRLSFEQLAQRAQRVVISRVISSQSEWDGSHRRIFTRTEIEVEEEVAGQGLRRLTLIQPGGTVDNLTQRTFGLASLQPGEKVMLFLAGQDKRLHVVGLSQGVFDLRGVGQQERLVQRLDLLNFPHGDGRPMSLSRKTAVEQIRTIFLKRKLK